MAVQFLSSRIVLIAKQRKEHKEISTPRHFQWNWIQAHSPHEPPGSVGVPPANREMKPELAGETPAFPGAAPRFKSLTREILFLRLQGVPGLSVERADNWIHGKVAGKFAAQDEFI